VGGVAGVEGLSPGHTQARLSLPNTKYADIKGVAVLASARVADEPLQRTWFLGTRMNVTGRPVGVWA
jgi:hypothetical protein